MPRQSPYATEIRHFSRSAGMQSVDRTTLEVLKDLRKNSEIYPASAAWLESSRPLNSAAAGCASCRCELVHG